MKIAALRLFNVKRFAGRGVAIEGISDGVNVLCAANEFGKSTSFEALHALFFQPHTGTPGDVQRLRPYSGGNPMIEADIETSAGKFRLGKQYYGGKFARVTELSTGRLVAQSDEAENFISDLVSGGSSGPAGLLWVRQGITGIERRTKTEEDNEKQLRASLLESVQGEVEAITGGRRMADIMEACAEALSMLVTAGGRPKAGGRYALAIEERDRLAADERRLSGEVDALRDALAKRAIAVERLTELERLEDRQERRAAIEQAQAALERAKAQRETLRTAEAEFNLARDRREAANRDLTQFREALSEAARLNAQLQTSEQIRKDAVAQRGVAFDAISKAHAQADAAEQERQQAQELLARLEGALRARDAAERLAELTQRLGLAEAARKSLEEGEAALAILQLPANSIDDLQELEIEIARLRAVADAARATVKIDYAAGSPIRATLDGAVLEDGEEQGYEAQAQLSIPGMGVVTLRSNHSITGNDRLIAAEEKRRALLVAMGVEDIAAARRREVEAQRKGAELGELRSSIGALAPEGLAALREDVARRSTASSDTLDLNGDPEQARIAFSDAQRRHAEAKNAVREVQPLRERADEAFVQAETVVASQRSALAGLDAALGPADSRQQREQTLVEKLASLDAIFITAQTHAETCRASALDLESAEAVLRRTRSVEDAAAKEAGTLRETIAGLNGQISRDSEGAIEEEWREASDALSATTRRVDAYEREVAVLQRLKLALDTARSSARDLYLKPVMSELRPLLSLLFEDVSITFDEKSLLPQTILRNGQEEDVERLSGGMREQLSVLTRLAFARLLARDGRPAPVILDDALVYSDDDRIERMFNALHRQAREQQIIVFSCRQRAFAKLGGNVLQMTDWKPTE